MSKKRHKRSFKQWKKQDSSEKKPEIKVVSSTPSAKVSRIIERDQRQFAVEPQLDWFVRPYAPGEFDEIAVSGEIDLSTIAYTLVKRMGPGSEQLRMPLTEEMAQSWLDVAAKSGGSLEQSKWIQE
jgi:hypothetical protein